MSDLISRQDAIDCFNGKIRLPYDMDTDLLKLYIQAVVDAIDKLPSYSEIPNKSDNGDLISRQAVINITAETGALETQARVMDLPSAGKTETVTEFADRCRECGKLYTKRQTGHWILSIEDWNKWTCSECGYSERTDIHVSLGYDYCPKCGARMVEEQESEDKK